jgi:hypothetical protein
MAMRAIMAVREYDKVRSWLIFDLDRKILRPATDDEIKQVDDLIAEGK